MSKTSESWLEGPSSTSFYTRLYTPTSVSDGSPRAVIVFIHGYDEHICRYENFHRAWASRGFSVFTFDLRGFGRTALDETHRSPGSVYGKMGTVLGDVEWAVRYVSEAFGKEVPVYLMGHSMGGGIVLDFIANQTNARDPRSIALLSGVIASSPWIRLTRPPPSLAVWGISLISKVFPDIHFSTPVRPEAISHDLSIGEALVTDPWVREYGTYQSVSDRFTAGIRLATEDYKHWPKDLPLLMLHGTADDLNLCPASEDFFKKVDALDKRLILYPDAYHDLMTEPDIKEKYLEDCISWVESHLSSIEAMMET
ncbi:lysophospholipase [Stereum hirsutum FP-91666 SS1]|uniref:lysophospholipase n=1 Tax=Stereum hirsutum (strain FP-91666) TaxID=721885 RepID=UPI000440B5D9|nr:lysophospholipase [Stereum hirsutum FP-91666 SS1]EIM89387.1 lysophospholipase [Stereum hirsutum FP-91666 SS1]